MADVTWREFIEAWRKVEGKGLTYSQAMVACSVVWKDMDARQAFINEHIRKVDIPLKEESLEPKPSPNTMDVKTVTEPIPIPIPNKSRKTLEYYQAKAKYYKIKSRK